MNCNKVINLLSAFMDGELLGYEHRLIHQHLQRCGDCRTEYDELLHMKRLLAAMRLRDPGQRLAASIVQRVAMGSTDPVMVGFGDWRVPIPGFRARPLFYSPIIGLGLGLTFFGLLFWAYPTSRAGLADSGHRSLVFEQANLARDEPPPHVGELTNGLMREAAPRPAAFETRYPVDLPDFPLAARQPRRAQVPVITTGLYH